MNNSIKFKRRLNHFLTYFYLVALSIIIIYPLLITIMSAFKTGNVLAFKLDTDINFSLENFSKLFTETLYGTWYFNTLIIAILTMIIQTSIVVLAGYAYSRYNFLARKQSLIFFLIIQMVPTMAALTAFFVCRAMLIPVRRGITAASPNSIYFRSCDTISTITGGQSPAPLRRKPATQQQRPYTYREFYPYSRL